MQKKNEKRFLVSNVIASELPDFNCFYYKGNTCHGQSMR